MVHVIILLDSLGVEDMWEWVDRNINLNTLCNLGIFHVHCLSESHTIQDHFNIYYSYTF